jgi:3-oxoacyl-[acyl-carrier-protein] synthase I
MTALENAGTTVAISAVGMCTPIGLTALASHAAMRARLDSFWLKQLVGGHGEPIRVSQLSLLEEYMPRPERMLAMSAWAFEDVALPVSIGTGARTAIALALPESDESIAFDADAFVTQWTEMVKSRLPGASRPVCVFRQGRSAFFFAVEHAISLLIACECDAVLIGAVDSLCSSDVLMRLDDEGRLLRPARHGTIPGEGAAFVLLERAKPRQAAETLVLGRLIRVSTALEPFHFLQDAPNTGQALSAVFRQLRSRWVQRADILFTCETGEPFWVAELSMAYLRNVPLMPEPFVRTIAAAAFGDLGAAAGGVMFVMGVHTLARLRRPVGSPPPLLLLCGSADRGHVGACLVQGVQ